MRPPSPDPTGPGQESVWDYPRPPRLEHVDRRIVVEFAGEVIVDTRDVVRVLETSHPPVYYLPIDALVPGVLRRGEGASFCEFKGRAAYFDVTVNGRVTPRVGWTYPEPSRGFEDLAGRAALAACVPISTASCVELLTIDQSQGRDFEVVLLTLVRANGQRDAGTLLCSDFFPGLGWMLTVSGPAFRPPR